MQLKHLTSEHVGWEIRLESGIHVTIVSVKDGWVKGTTVPALVGGTKKRVHYHQDSDAQGETVITKAFPAKMFTVAKHIHKDGPVDRDAWRRVVYKDMFKAILDHNPDWLLKEIRWSSTNYFEDIGSETIVMKVTALVSYESRHLHDGLAH